MLKRISAALLVALTLSNVQALDLNKYNTLPVRSAVAVALPTLALASLSIYNFCKATKTDAIAAKHAVDAVAEVKDSKGRIITAAVEAQPAVEAVAEKSRLRNGFEATKQTFVDGFNFVKGKVVGEKATWKSRTAVAACSVAAAYAAQEIFFLIKNGDLKHGLTAMIVNKIKGEKKA